MYRFRFSFSHPFLLMAALALSAGAAATPAVQIEKDDALEALRVTVKGEHVTTYHYSRENRKPFFWPVYGEGGVEVTRAWPMGPEEESTDHVHQKSLWTAHGDVNGTDLWGEGRNSGYQHTDSIAFGSGDAFGWIRAGNTWQDRERNPIVTEERQYTFYPTPASGRLFDVAVTFRADHGDVAFGDTKEGGLLAVRVRDELRTRSGGVITTSAGHTGEGETWGKPAAWCDYSGPLEGVGTRGIAVFDHPGNLRHPTRWHVRDYGLMAANCFGLSYFTSGDLEPQRGDYLLEEGKSLTFRYRVYVHSGNAQEAGVQRQYEDYAAAP